MSKNIEPCFFRCAVCKTISPTSESNVMFLSNCLLLMIPPNWKYISKGFEQNREVIDFICPDCQKKDKSI